MNKYQEYALLKADEKVLKAKIALLQNDIINDLSEKDGNKLETDIATFSLMTKKKYKYSDMLLEKEKLAKDQIKILKKKEEIEGVAECLQDGWMLRCQLVK